MRGFDEEAMGLWKTSGAVGKGTVILAKGVTVTGQLLIGAGVSYAVHRVLAGGEPPSDDALRDWVIQGTGLVVGHMVGARASSLHNRARQLGAAGKQLTKRAEVEIHQAEAVTESTDPSIATKLLIEQRVLLLEEQRILAELRAKPHAEGNGADHEASDPTTATPDAAHDPARAPADEATRGAPHDPNATRDLEHDAAASPKRATGDGEPLTPRQLARLAAESSADLATASAPGTEEAPFRLAGVEELVPGALWTGTREQITAAIEQARAADLPVRVLVEGGAQARWQLELSGGRTVQVQERLPRPGQGKRGKPLASRLREHKAMEVGSPDSDAATTSTPDHKSPKEQPHVAQKNMSSLEDFLKSSGLDKLSHEDLTIAKRLLLLNIDDGKRILTTYGGEAIDYLRTNPLTTIRDLDNALSRQRKQVRVRTPGFYDGIDVSGAPDGWTFHDQGPTAEPGSGSLVLRTNVRGPNGADGYFERAFNPRNGDLELRMAFLKLSGRDLALPSKIGRQEHGVEMIEGSGSPTVQYITLYQMKKLGVSLGGAGGRQVENIHMSDIQNVETVVHLHYLRCTLGGELSDLTTHTASVKYAETTALQTGYVRSAAPLLSGGQESPIGSLMAFQEGGNPARIRENDEILKRYGFDRDTPMFWGFDIDFLVRPAK
jgi:hypothetical protein